MKKWILILISLLLFILDNSFIPSIAIKGVMPSLLFVFAIAYSIINDRKEAVLIGVISGVMQDVFFYAGGINALLNMIICFLVAIIGKNIYREKKLIPILITLAASFVKLMGIFIIYKLAGRGINFEISLYSILYNAFIMFLGYNFVLKLCDNEYKKKSWRF